jgi:hypothetical protein
MVIDEPQPSGEIVKKTKWNLYAGRTVSQGDTDLILDKDSYIRPLVTNITVEPETDDNVITEMCNDVSLKGRKSILSVVGERLDLSDEVNKEASLSYLVKTSGVLKRPVPRISDLSVLQQMDWVDFIESLVEYRCQKDERVKLFLKKDLLRGINPRLNPNGIIAKNPGVGVTEFYQQLCSHIGKATKNSFIGFARSPLEVYPGTIHEQDITQAIDQIESQEAQDIFGYLFDIAEQGQTTVSSGGVKFPVRSNAKIVFIANVQPSRDPTKSFSYLQDHIAVNSPAFMKRIGVLLYNDNLDQVKAKETSEMSGWSLRGDYFRAVEEMTYSTLRKYYYDDDVWKWSQKPLEDYAMEIKDISSGIADVRVARPFEEHGKGAQPRIRGAGLSIALTEKLNEIALGHTLDLKEDILRPSEEYAHVFVEINKQSISRIANTWDTQKDRMRRSVFDSVFPEYIKEIVMAMSFYLQTCQKEEIATEISARMLCGMPYKCKYHEYLSQAFNQAVRRKGSFRKYNSYLKEYFDFELVKDREGNIGVTLFG